MLISRLGGGMLGGMSFGCRSLALYELMLKNNDFHYNLPFSYTQKLTPTTIQTSL